MDILVTESAVLHARWIALITAMRDDNVTVHMMVKAHHPGGVPLHLTVTNRKACIRCCCQCIMPCSGMPCQTLTACISSTSQGETLPTWLAVRCSTSGWGRNRLWCNTCTAVPIHQRSARTTLQAQMQQTTHKGRVFQSRI